jgi:hypothetical protein
VQQVVQLWEAGNSHASNSTPATDRTCRFESPASCVQLLVAAAEARYAGIQRCWHDALSAWQFSTLPLSLVWQRSRSSVLSICSLTS